MTEEEVLALLKTHLADSVKTALEPIVAQLGKDIDKRVLPLEAALTEPKTKPEAKTEDDPSAKRLKLLEDKLAEMQQAKEASDRRSEDMTIEQSIRESLSKSKALHSDWLSKQLFKDLRDGLTKDVDGTFIDKDGKAISARVEEFLKTETGKHFLPSQAVSGAGTPRAKSAVKSDNGASTQDIINAFL